MVTFPWCAACRPTSRRRLHLHAQHVSLANCIKVLAALQWLHKGAPTGSMETAVCVPLSYDIMSRTSSRLLAPARHAQARQGSSLLCREKRSQLTGHSGPQRVTPPDLGACLVGIGHGRVQRAALQQSALVSLCSPTPAQISSSRS